MAFVEVGGGSKTAPEPDTKDFWNKCMNNWSYLTFSYLHVTLSGKEQVALWASGKSALQITWSSCPSLGRGKQWKVWVYLLMDAVF